MVGAGPCLGRGGRSAAGLRDSVCCPYSASCGDREYGADAILTFALAAPMLNPISLLYGVSYLGPQLLSVLALGTFIVAVAVGMSCANLGSDGEGVRVRAG